MAAREIIVGIIFISQTSVGVLGNFYLLFQYFFLPITRNRLRSTDLIVMHLIIANFLTLLCKGIPQAMTVLDMNVYLDDAGCKLVFYLHRVGRGVTISSTCLLSVLQAIIISPNDSRWAELKVKAPRYIGCSLSLTWILSLLVNISLPMYLTGKWTNANLTHVLDFMFCVSVHRDRMVTIPHTVFVLIPDVSGMVFMLLSSSSMVFILYRHRQRMRHMHGTKGTLRSHVYSKATKTILHLVSAFVFFYTLSCICHILISFSYNSSWLLVNTAAIASGCFPCMSPFLLMRCKLRFCSDQVRYIKA